MRRLFIASILWLLFVSSASASFAQFMLTRSELDSASDFKFAVATNVANGGVGFRVTITGKHHDIYSDSRVGVYLVVRKKGDGDSSVRPLKPAIPIKLKQEKRVWTADFTVSDELLRNPEVCFVFTVIGHATINGKTTQMPWAESYELRLKDFTEP